MVKVLVAWLLTGMLCPGPTAKAQTMISESGRLLFFNSLDSAQGAAIARLATLAACWLETQDRRDSFPVLLDLRPNPDNRSGNSNSFTDSATSSSPDSATIELGYDNLYGNSLQFPDSATEPADLGERPYFLRLGLRIRIPNPSADPRILLRLLEYGVTHYATLRQMHALCLA